MAARRAPPHLSTRVATSLVVLTALVVPADADGYVVLSASLRLADVMQLARPWRSQVVAARAQRALADQMASAAIARYSTNAGIQAEGLRAQLEVDRLDCERSALRQEVTAAEVILDTALARSPDAEIPEREATVADASPPDATKIEGTALGLAWARLARTTGEAP